MKSNIKTDIDISPNEGDVILVSVDRMGTPGELNSSVLKTLGYSSRHLPSPEQLQYGFGTITDTKRKSVIFVVTVDGNNTRENLEKNLYNTLAEFRGWFRKRNLWIPLMGTGAGGLTLQESYSIIYDVIEHFQNEYPTETTILLSIPNTKEGKELLKKIKGLQENQSKKGSIPFLNSDSDQGNDYLDIRTDVNAFAKVISAKNFTPPLAIALFGKWGSGKSFFMSKLKQRISKLSESENDSYCKGVVQIHFNAWSYMDCNLWASIVTKIFEELNVYITENSKTLETKKEIEKLLTNQLSIAKEEISSLESRKNAAAEQIKILEKKKKSLTDELETKISTVRTNTVWQFIETVDKEFKAKDKIIKVAHENNSFISTEKQLKKIIPEEYWDSPEKAYQVINSKYTFLKEFFKKENRVSNFIWSSIIIITILAIPVVLKSISIELKKLDFTISQVTLSILIAVSAILKKAKTTYNKLQPTIAAFWKIKKSYEERIKQATSKFEQEEKALKLDIEKQKAETLLVEEQIQKTESIKTDLEFRIENALATETLYSFIDKRSKTDDYKKHLGIISLIRNDFEILNDLFIEHRSETIKIQNAKKFKEKFRKPLERIVLYIDDLDRCPEENVVQVLEAVNLLMAFPLFVVIVGVDSRWVRNALLKKHSLQFTKDNGNDFITELLEPSNYLEKIFQIPFHLKKSKDSDIKEMIKNLATDGRNSSKKKSIAYAEKDYVEDGYFEDGGLSENDEEISETIQLFDDNFVLANNEELILSDDEIVLMQNMSEIIGSNPRAIKRFVNIYRIIKVHEEFTYEIDLANKELISILFLIALPLGNFKKLLPSFEIYVQNKDNYSKQFSTYLNANHETGELDGIKAKLGVCITNNKDLLLLKKIHLSIFYKHLSFIKRFSF